MSYTSRTHRALIERERLHLKREELGLDKFVEVTIVIFALLIGAVVAATYIPRLSSFVGPLTVIAVCTLLVLVYLLYMLSKYKRDLNDHVYEIHGTMIKKGNLSTDHRITVGRHTFRVTPANPQLLDFYLKHKNGCPVSVYYSPRTKIVWNIHTL